MALPGLASTFPETATVRVAFSSRGAARRVERDLRSWIGSLEATCKRRINEDLRSYDAKINSLSLGIAMAQLPGPRFSLVEDDTDADLRANHLGRLIVSSLDQIETETDENNLRINYSHQPVETKQVDLALANFQLILAHDLFERDRHDLSADMLARTTKLVPDVPQAWMLRAWETAFNQSGTIDDVENRYKWIRSGLDALLDGVEQNPQCADLLWHSAHIIHRRVCSSEERSVFRELFADDKELHTRLENIISLESTASPVHEVDADLVANELFKVFIKLGRAHPNATSVPQERLTDLTNSTQISLRPIHDGARAMGRSEIVLESRASRL